MTTNPGEPEVLATIETHAVAAQPIEVIRHPDGSIDARAGAAYWSDDNPFSGPGGELYNVDTEEWGSHDDVPAWAGADVPDGVVIDVAVGDFPELPAPGPATSGTVAEFRRFAATAELEERADLRQLAYRAAVEQATAIVDRLERLWRYITIDPNTGQPRRPGDGPSSADTCEELYAVLGGLGLEVS